MIGTRAIKVSEAPLMVTASALGQFAFCPEAARLASLGVRQHRQARRRMAEGEVAHRQWQRHEDRAPKRADRAGRLVLALAILLAVLAFVWWGLRR